MTTEELLAIIGRLMVERDDARRRVCYMFVEGGKPHNIKYRDYAVEHGWDCFHEDQS